MDDIDNARRPRNLIHWAARPSVVIVDHPNSGCDADLAAIVAALQVQATRDFAPLFQVDCVVTTAKEASPDAWVIGLFSDPDQPGALGYHDTTPTGLPLAKVFPKLDAQDGSALSVTISHELLEMLADPLLSKAVQSPDGKFWAYEVCDAVENDQYLIDKVPVSNFVTPQYFEPPPSSIGILLDQMGLLKTPYEVRPGGYMQYFASGGWHQVLHKETARRSYRVKTSGRTARRVARTRVVDATT